jgi:hypothetical protein
MKTKLFIIAALLITSTFVNAQDFKIIPKAKLEYDISKSPYRMTPYNGTSLISSGIVLGRMMTGIGLDFVYKNFSISFDNETFMADNIKEMAFHPTQANFIFNFKYTFKGNYKIYIEHACFHPLTSVNGIGYEFENSGVNMAGYMGGYTNIGISFNY